MAALDSLETPPPALTALSEDEKFFQTTVRKFAREQIRPHVREMDEAGVFRKDIIKQFFEMGLIDRKSTRLNSSHLGISYAVFCLKKKKTHEKTLFSSDCTSIRTQNRCRLYGS